MIVIVGGGCPTDIVITKVLKGKIDTLYFARSNGCKPILSLGGAGGAQFQTWSSYIDG